MSPYHLPTYAAVAGVLGATALAAPGCFATAAQLALDVRFFFFLGQGLFFFFQLGFQSR